MCRLTDDAGSTWHARASLHILPLLLAEVPLLVLAVVSLVLPPFTPVSRLQAERESLWKATSEGEKDAKEAWTKAKTAKADADKAATEKAEAEAEEAEGVEEVEAEDTEEATVAKDEL